MEVMKVIRWVQCKGKMTNEIKRTSGKERKKVRAEGQVNRPVVELSTCLAQE